MPLKIIEQFVQSKTVNPADCEDAIVATADYIAVFDGAGSRSGLLYEGKTPGAMAVAFLTEALQDLQADLDARMAVDILSQSINRVYERLSLVAFFNEKPWERFIASAVIYSRHRRELWFVGDCQALVGSRQIQYGNPLDKVKELARCAMIEDALLRADDKASLKIEIQKTDFTQAVIWPIVLSQSSFQNTAHPHFGHGVFDGTPVPESMIFIHPVDVSITELCMTSDGYPIILPSLQATEEHLQHLLFVDPLCYKQNPQIKGVRLNGISYDDRSYVRFAI